MTQEETITYCANHPTVETSLRCRTCDKLICAKCAIRTPTGYRCKECVRGHQKIFNTAQWYDYLTGFIAAGVLSGIASFLMTLIGFIGFFGWFIAFAAAPTAGAIIAETVRRITGRRRAKNLFLTVMAGAVAGVLPIVIFHLLIGDFFGLILPGIYVFVGLPALYYRLSGIQLFK